MAEKRKSTKKRISKKQKCVSKKQGIFFVMRKGIQNILDNFREFSFMKKIRKEQRHCLQFKRYKKKQSFCFVKALLFEYPWKTMFGFTVVAVMGLSVITTNFQRGEIVSYFGLSLQTNLISQLTAKISSLRGQISDRQKCTQDKYWTENQSNVCNYWLYNQENKHCAKFNVPTERVAIGTKMCCNPLESIVYSGDKKNVTACPGSDIFFGGSVMHDATLVADISGCRPGVCQFYPSDGNIIRFDTEGNIMLGNQGQPLVVRPCSIERTLGPCSKECGGGQRTVTGTDMYCNDVNTTELCNVEPCFAETIVN